MPPQENIIKTENNQPLKKPIHKRDVPMWSLVLIIFLLLIVSAILISILKKNSYTLLLPDSKGKVTADLQYGSWPMMQSQNFFADVRNKFIDEKANFIEADLASMTLKVYKGGVLREMVNIASKGREGSWWETPAGLYKIENKEKNHFSSFGQVNQPWSMVFQGNFFIHGWPTHKDGTPVSSTYSGGCIRLKDEDAEKVYNLTNIGMPVLVHEKDFASDGYQYLIKSPKVSATNYLSADLKNNFVFTEKNSSEIKPIASITKLVTALVATEYINLEKKVTITDSMIVKTSFPRLKPGESYRVYDLLFPLLLESSNEAGEAIAQSYGKDKFVALMNKKVQAIGMRNTKFVDSTGIGEGNISTAEELFTLAKYIYNNRSFIFKITSGRINSSAYGKASFTNVSNFNDFNELPNYVGGKVGQTTAAGETIISVFEEERFGEKRPVVIIILNSTDRKKDTQTILDYMNWQFDVWPFVATI